MITSLITGITFLIILVILVIIHEFGHYIVAKKSGVYVEEFGFGFPPKIWGKKFGETEYTVNSIPLGGFVRLYGEEYHEQVEAGEKPPHPLHRAFVSKAPWQKTAILVAGVVMNFILGWIIFSYLLVRGIPSPAGIAVREIQANTPAQEAGLISNDILKSVSIDGKTIPLQSAPDLVRATGDHAGTMIGLTIIRDNEEMTLLLTPRENPPEGEGALGVVIQQLVQTKQYPWYQAPFYGFLEAANTLRQIWIELLRIPATLMGRVSGTVEFAGPIGIAKIVGEARQYGLDALLQITALLSLNLAVINIFPFPALDGGRLVFVFYEWITGKPSNRNLEKYLNLGGIIILLSLSALITLYDIQKLWG